jgi:hypothetical protein
MSNSQANDRSPSDSPEPNQVIADSQNTILVVADGIPDTTIRPSRHPIMREWPRPRMPKPPQKPER